MSEKTNPIFLMRFADISRGRLKRSSRARVSFLKSQHELQKENKKKEKHRPTLSCRSSGATVPLLVKQRRPWLSYETILSLGAAPRQCCAIAWTPYLNGKQKRRDEDAIFLENNFPCGVCIELMIKVSLKASRSFKIAVKGGSRIDM